MNSRDIEAIGWSWVEITKQLRNGLMAMDEDDFCQPIKPYINTNVQESRIIAMPAFIGGVIMASGVKWISSFPANKKVNIPRSHSITILNDCETGAVKCIIESSKLSGLRTAGVSAVLLEELLAREGGLFSVGIIGCGHIALLHLEMLQALFGRNLAEVYAFDLDPSAISSLDSRFQLVRCRNPEEVVLASDVLITATTSVSGYIAGPPKSGAVILNISLRDFCTGFCRNVDHMIVDNWNEVCRKDTDIQKMYLAGLIREDQVLTLEQVALKGKLRGRSPSEVVMFNPMGLAVFDIALAQLFYDRAIDRGIGREL